MKFSSLLSYLYTPVVSTNGASLRGNGMSTVDETQIILHGINKELTSYDVQLMEQSLTSAYQKVFKNSAPTTFAMDLTAGIDNLKQ